MIKKEGKYRCFKYSVEQTLLTKICTKMKNTGKILIIAAHSKAMIIWLICVIDKIMI